MGSQAVDPITLKVLSDFDRNLSALTFNSKPVITTLTMIAGKFRNLGPIFVQKIEQAILQAQPSQRLPRLYLIDSIIKNVGQPYASMFTPKILVLFCSTYASSPPNSREPMLHLMRTWKGYFPSQVLVAIEQRLAQIRYEESIRQGSMTVPVQMHPPHVGQHAGFGHQPALSGYGGVTGAYGVPGGLQGQPMGGGRPATGAPYGGAPVGVPSIPADVLSSLVSSGVLGPGGAGPPRVQEKKVLGANKVTAKQPGIGTDFKDVGTVQFKEGLIKSLYDDIPYQCKTTGRRFDSQEKYSKHLDALFLKNRRAATGGAHCRQYYPQGTAWLMSAGTGSTGGEEVPAKVSAAPTAAEALRMVCSLPVDDNQKQCAITGETFETFWHPEEDEWHYRDAVRLTSDLGIAKAGQLVLRRCLDSAPAPEADVQAPATKRAKTEE